MILILAFLNFMAFAIGPDVERDGGNETIDFFSQIEIWIVQIFVMGANNSIVKGCMEKRGPLEEIP